MTKLVRFDWAIKYLLRNKANFDILEGFLSELLKIGVHIETILESEGNQNHANDKFNRVDLLAKTTDGQHIIIEVQCTTQADFLSRVLYGASKVVCEYMHIGDAYHNIRKVISVSIVFFDLGEGKDYLYHGSTIFKGMHYHDTLNLNANERDVYGQPSSLALQTPAGIFPEYYIIKVMAFKEQVKDKLDEWVYFLKNSKIEKEFDAQGIQSAAKKLDLLQLSDSERRTYRRFQESLSDDASWVATMNAERAVAKARGEAIGEARGEVRGIKKSREEIALRLFEKNMSDEEIAAITNLSIKRIKALRQQG